MTTSARTRRGRSVGTGENKYEAEKHVVFRCKLFDARRAKYDKLLFLAINLSEGRTGTHKCHLFVLGILERSLRRSGRRGG